MDGSFLSDEDTPVEPPRCVECGNIVFHDAADMMSDPVDRCLRSLTVVAPGEPCAGQPRWHSCAKLRKSVSHF